ncbi:MAG: T9SS type A sorting domain-containing protein [Bacteroidia bacterium]
MKRFTYLSLLLFLVNSQSLSAQSPIVGGDFENWTTDTLLETFAPFQSSAAPNYFEIGIANVRAVNNDLNGTAVHLESYLNDDSEIVTGLFWLGDFGPAGLVGGEVCTAMPDSAFVRLRYSMEGADEFLLGWRFEQNGQQVALTLETVPGVDTSFHWVGFNLANYSATPDKISFLAASSNLLNGSVNEEGSWVEIDSMYFSDGNTCITNSGWETYESLDFDEPNDWHTTNRYTQLLGYNQQAASQETDPNLIFSGNSSLRLETISDTNAAFFDTTGFVWNGNGFGEEGFDGGQAVPASNPMPSNISGFYHYQAVGGADTALAYARFWYYDATLDSTFELESAIALAPTDSFRYFAIPLNLSFAPDSFSLIFAASDNDHILSQSITGIGSTLWLDQLFFDGVNALTPALDISLDFKVFPNPTADFVRVRLAERHAEPLQLKLLDLQGRVLQSYQLDSLERQIDLRALAAGTYILQVQNQNGQQLAFQKLVLMP